MLALIVYEPGIEYIVALLGCFYASVIAVPVYPPDPMRVARTLFRLESIVQDARADAILTTRAMKHWTDALVENCPSLKLVSFTEELGNTESALLDWVPPQTSRNDLALLQYTSGSTGTPKGCMITHANLLYNFQHIQQFDEPDAIIVSWLPMYHDMGLIGTVLQTLYSGRRLVLMSPLSFVQRPFRWLQAISKYRAYATSGPNFAYELCVRKVSDEERQQLDLSCWSLACNGAEQVRSETIDRFTEKFAQCGFRRETFYPCYGLAEATLIVTGGKKYEAPVVVDFDADQLAVGRVQVAQNNSTATRRLVGCGKQVEGCLVKIVDGQTHVECPSGEVGEVWVNSPGVGSGYWGRPKESVDVFLAQLATGDQIPFMRTGDLGFVLDGELFLVGRCKDLLIVNGRNHYPHDIEDVVQGCHSLLRRDASAAFSVIVNDEERLVVVQEVVRPQKADLQEILASIRSELALEVQLDAHAIVLVKGGTVPKTSSGKIQRQACREQFLMEQLDVVAIWQESADRQPDRLPDQHNATPSTHGAGLTLTERNPANRGVDRNEVSQAVTDLLRKFKPQYAGGISLGTRMFSELGLASIDAIEFHSRLEDRFGQSFHLDEWMADIGEREVRDVTIGELVDFLCNRIPSFITLS